jgi:hypothetical protein
MSSEIDIQTSKDDIDEYPKIIEQKIRISTENKNLPNEIEHLQNYLHVLDSIIVQQQQPLLAKIVLINSFHQQILPKDTLLHQEFVLSLHSILQIHSTKRSIKQKIFLP